MLGFDGGQKFIIVLHVAQARVGLCQGLPCGGSLLALAFKVSK